MKSRVSIYLMSATLFIVSQLILSQTFGAAGVILGDPNVEQWSDTIGGDIVQAYTVITANAPTLITTVSMFLLYSGSDGSQCMYFGIYPDNGSGSPAGQRLVTATKQAYCLGSASTWGPAWQTWKLPPYDYLTIGPGTYWLCTLAKQTYGTVYHYSYASGADWSYGTSSYYFAATFDYGFPQFFSSNPSSATEGPYSFYVTGITA